MEDYLTPQITRNRLSQRMTNSYDISNMSERSNPHQDPGNFSSIQKYSFQAKPSHFAKNPSSGVNKDLLLDREHKKDSITTTDLSTKKSGKEITP